MKRAIFILLALAACSILALAAEVYPDFIVVSHPSSSVEVNQQNWVASAAGTTTITLYNLNGVALGFTISPKSGTNAPAALYDMTLTNSRGVDVLGGQGANLSATATTTFWTSISDQSGNPMPVTLSGDYQLVVSNAGNGGRGTIYIDISKARR